MKIAANQNWYDLSEPIEYRTAELTLWSSGDPEKNPDSYQIFMSQLRWREFAEGRLRTLVGTPTAWAVQPDGKKLWIAPTPDCDVWLTLRYHPAMKVI